MKLTDIFSQCSKLKIKEVRCQTNDFIEIVFHNEDLSEWARILTANLGQPRKPSGKDPSEADIELTSRTGGIRIEQTLYESEYSEGIIIAKFWPWKDERHTTLRMAFLKK